MRRKIYSHFFGYFLSGFLLLQLFHFSICCPSFASAASNRDVTAGVFNFDGYHMKDDQGKLDGYGINLLRLLSEYSHLNFNYAGFDSSWRDMQEMLKNGEIDILTSARRTPEREKLFAFSLPVGRNYTLLFARADNPNIQGGDYATYNNIHIGALKGSSQNKHLEEFAKNKGFNYQLKEYENPGQLARALQTGDVDAILSSNLRRTSNEKTIDIIKIDNFYVIARKEDQDIIDEINYAINQMNQNEGDWQNDLYYRYYGPKTKHASAFTDREKSYIKNAQDSSRKIRVISRGDIKPYSYIENGKLMGILPDYFSKIMNDVGLDFELVAPANREEYNHLLKENTIDVVLDRAAPVEVFERENQPGFTTDAYMTTGMARVMRQDFSGDPKKIAIANVNALDLDPEYLANMEIIKFNTPDEAMQAVYDGKADAAYVFPYTAQLFVNNMPDESLYYTMLNNKGAELKMYIPSSTDHELISILNKKIRTVPPSILNQITYNYTAFNPDYMTIKRYLRANPAIFAVALISFISAAVFIIFLIVRSKWNKRLLVHTEKANKKLESQLAIVEALSRDYLNVFAINNDSNQTKIIKLAGYAPSGIDLDKNREQSYPLIIEAYINERVHPEERSYVEKAFSLPVIKEHLKNNDEYSVIYRTGDEKESNYFQFTCVSLGKKQSNSYILAGFRNIDEMIRRELEQKEALSNALAQAKYANAAKTTFLNNMSHDIRTPMNAIIGFTSLAVSNIDNNELVSRYLAKIQTSGNHLLNLINDVLDMSRIESGKVKIEEKETSLPEIIQDLKTIVQADVKAKKLDFQIIIHNIINEIIYCDRLRLNQVLLNILSNAIKYTIAGGAVKMEITQLAAKIADMARYEFKISDTGIGMSKKFLEGIFEPFEREQTSTVSGIQGTGLGLAITKNIVDMMKGEIYVKSEVNKGSEFTVIFDFRIAEREDLSRVLPHMQGKRALIIDDDADACKSISQMLAALGMAPEWITDANKATERCHTAIKQGDPYAAYFIDSHNINIDFKEFVRNLRQMAGFDAAIYLLTTKDWADMEEEASQAGISGFCSKPVFLSKLRQLFYSDLEEPQNAEVEEKNELFAGKRILLAEDNEMNQEIAQVILESAGFTLQVVENGQEAINRLQEAPAGYFDLVLMDVQMPVMDGYAATRAIRRLSDPGKANITVLAMTANAFEEDKKEAMSAGMNGYISKPIDMKELMKTLRKVFQTRK